MLGAFLYQKELNAIKKSNLLRTRNIFDDRLLDLASNDYLGFASNKKLFNQAYKAVKQHKIHASKASMLVNGYHPVHKEFEENLCQANGFEDGVVVGSGFLANLSMIEALVRKGDILFMDEEYHASGILASKLLDEKQVIVFKHNDNNDLEQKMQQHKAKNRQIIAIEGIYSMSGHRAKKAFFDVAEKYNALLIVDEAHSSGVIGDNLMGLFDYYGISVQRNHIKMGTLGKAYGSYGAYILASAGIIEFLINRAKAIIYTTAPSVFDMALGNEALKYIIKNKASLTKKIQQRQQIIKDLLELECDALIVAYEIADNKKVLKIQEVLKEKGFLVGAIRQPTVDNAIIRLIAKIDISKKQLTEVCQCLKSY